MKANEIRNWLGIYFFASTAFWGAYILLFAGTHLLPINESDCNAAFQIMIPFLVGQVTIVFKWLAGDQKLNSSREVKLPVWAVKGPPIATTVILIATFVSLIITARSETGTWIEGTRFKSIVTFAVALLNASTVFLVMKIFGAKEESNSRPGNEASI